MAKTMKQINLFTPDMLDDPYPVYRRLREESPVHFHAPFGAWVLSRYDDVLNAFHDPRFSPERAEPLRSLAATPDLDPFFHYLGCRMDFKEPPRHTRLRGLVSKAFTPHMVESLAPRIQGIVDDLLDRVVPQGQMDVIRDLAFPLPGTVIGDLLGVPTADLSRLKAWSDAFVGFFKTVPSETTAAEYRRSQQAAQELGDYYRNILATPGSQDTLLRRMAATEIDGERLTEVELSANATLLLHAGHETTTHLIGNGLLALLQRPEQSERLRNDPSLLPTAVEEFLRYDSPVQFTYRIATEDFDLHGNAIRKGQVLHMLLASANRDPAHFANPDDLDITRHPNKHTSFGHGHHFCLGAALARLEAQVAIGTLLQRFPALRLAEESSQRQANFVLRGLVSLPVGLR